MDIVIDPLDPQHYDYQTSWQTVVGIYRSTNAPAATPNIYQCTDIYGHHHK